MIFEDRRAAGRMLSKQVAHLAAARPIVVGLTPGGVVVADEVARALEAPLDLVAVRELSAPWQPEIAVASFGSGPVSVVSGTDPAVAWPVALDPVVEFEVTAAVGWARRLRGPRPVALDGRTVLLVHDGFASPSAAIAAARLARELGAERVALASPFDGFGAARSILQAVDEMICGVVPGEADGTGFYTHPDGASDEEIRALLDGPGEVRAGSG